MTGKHFHTIVIGSGPGGEGAAMKLTKRGKSVAVIERYREVGGGCTHWGTIPSKALRHSVQRMMDYNASPLFRELSEPRHLSFPQVLRQAESVINKQVGLRFGFYQRNDVPVFFGQAAFVDEHTLEVASDVGRVSRFTADHFVLATGSRPYHPEDVDFSALGVYDSDSILTLKDTPRTITIYGAGVIGSEYASIFRGLGVKVDLVNTRDRLLEFLDDEISDALSYHLREMGTVIRHAESYSRVEPGPDGVTLHLESGKRLKNEVLLWANGRSGNTEAMGLEALNLQPNSRGQLEVNERFQTALPHIYAVGDVIGFPSLASAAYDQGRYAAHIIVDGDAPYEMATEYPTGIYTIPEISSLGRSERELTAAKVPFEVGHAFFKDLARAQISGHAVGMLKILFHTETLEILGIHCFGDQASEIVHIGQAIMAQPGSANSLRYFMNTTFNYPTMAEAYRVAALNGYNRLD